MLQGILGRDANIGIAVHHLADEILGVRGDILPVRTGEGDGNGVVIVVGLLTLIAAFLLRR